MTIYGDKKLLAFTRPGYKAWIDIKSPTRCYDDIAFYKGKFYVVDCHGEVFVCRTDDDQKLEFKVIVPRPKEEEEKEEEEDGRSSIVCG